MGPSSLRWRLILQNRARARNPRLSPAFYSPCTTKSIFSHLKVRIPPGEKSGVYSIKCSDCPAVYVGQTGRQLKLRITEHEKAIQNGTPERSNFAKHVLSEGHTFDRDSCIRLLHILEKSKKMTALENIEIIKASNCPEVNVVNEFIPLAPLASLM